MTFLEERFIYFIWPFKLKALFLYHSQFLDFFFLEKSLRIYYIFTVNAWTVWELGVLTLLSSVKNPPVIIPTPSGMGIYPTADGIVL